MTEKSRNKRPTTIKNSKTIFHFEVVHELQGCSHKIGKIGDEDPS